MKRSKIRNAIAAAAMSAVPIVSGFAGNGIAQDIRTLQLAGVIAQYEKLTPEQKADFSLDKLLSNEVGFYLGDFNGDGKVAPLPTYAHVHLGQDEMPELCTYLLTPVRFVNGSPTQTGNPVHVGIRNGKTFLLQNKKWTAQEFTPAKGAFYFVKGAADWKEPLFGRSLYNEEDANKAGVLGLIQDGVTQAYGKSWDRFRWRIERVPSLGKVRYTIVANEIADPVEGARDRVALTGAEYTIPITGAFLDGTIQKGLEGIASTPQKPVQRQDDSTELEVLALGGVGNPLVNRNSRDQYGNPISVNERERVVNLGYSAKVPVALGPALIRYAVDGTHFGADRKSVINQSVDRQSFGAGVRFGPVTALGLVDWPTIVANKTDGPLNSTARLTGQRLGGAARLQSGRFSAELGYLEGDLDGNVTGSLAGIPVNVPGISADSQIAYLQAMFGTSGYRFGTDLVYEALAGDAQTEMFSVGATALTKPLSTKAGDFRLGARVGYNAINNHGYSPNSNGLSASAAIHYAKRLENLRRPQVR